MKLNITGKITKFFLENRPLTILLLISSILMGGVSYWMTSKQYNPEVTMPVFQVSIDYPGATAQEVEDFITRELEEKISDIEGVDKIFSQSIDGGKAISTVQFFVGENLEDSKVRLTNKILGNIDLKRGKIKTPIIKSISADDVPILTIGFSSPTLSQNEVRTRVIEIMNDLKIVKNTANIAIHGGEPQALNVTLDTGKMKARKVDIGDIKRAFSLSNFRLPSGKIKDNETIIPITIDGNISNIELAKKLIILPGIQLQDIAMVQKGTSEKVSIVEVLKQESLTPTVFISIAKRKGENAMTVSTDIQKKLKEIFKNPKYKEIQYTVFRDEGKTAQVAISGLLKNFFSSIIIVAMVLYIFLGLRASSIVAIVIPLTIALVFIAGFLADQTINRVTLFALILSLGLLVDSATVVVENIFRHFQEQGGKDRHKAIIKGVDEVGIGLFLSTLTSVIVFLPTAKITGMMGDYMGPLSFFVPMALILSLLVAYIITPFLADLLLPQSHKIDPPSHGKIFKKVIHFYEKFLEKILENKQFKKRFLWFIFGSLFMTFLLPAFALVHFKMLPSADKNQFFIYIDAPENTNTPKTEKIAKSIARIVLKNKNITSIQSFVGEPPVIDFNGLFKGAQFRSRPYQATLRVNLIDKSKRSIKSTPLINQIRKDILKTINKDSSFPPITLRLLEDPPGPPVRSTLMAKVKGPDRTVLEKVSKDIQSFFKTIDNVVDIDLSIKKPTRQITFVIDQEKALSTGVNTQQVIELLQTLGQHSRIGQFHIKESKEMSFIELYLPADKYDEISDLDELFIKNYFGKMVPLSSVVKKYDNKLPPILYLDDREKTIFVSAELENRSVIYATIDAIKKVINYKFPNGAVLKNWNLFGLNFETDAGEIYSIEWGGEWKMTLENFRDLGIAMIGALVLIYIILVAQFKSFSIPGKILSTIPLSFLGILPGFFFLDISFGIFLTATSLIGFIALMGIVVNNAIIYLEYFEVLIKKMSRKAALLEAGKTRLRPILLTSMTTVLGNLTIVSDPVWSGLAWSIVFGLSISAIFTLGVFPALMDED